jgi:gamma-glutamylcyclotransferase (GGCT)/AIG2-like uncharacterized protein YtfP
MRLFVFGMADTDLSSRSEVGECQYIAAGMTRDVFHIAGTQTGGRFYCAREWLKLTGKAIPVLGNVYDVSPGMLGRLDRLEDCPRTCQRHKVELTSGEKADMYVLVNMEVIADIRSSKRFVAIE